MDQTTIDGTDSSLVYVSDSGPGIKRLRRGRGFCYLHADGTPVTDREARARIKSLVIPPAWNDVWICCDASGHLQATGRDSRGRKQYRYHPEWSRLRSETKFQHLLAFGAALAPLRKTIRNDLRRRKLVKRKVVAIAIALLDECAIRVGNGSYKRENHTYGLTTLQDRHVRIAHNGLHLHFRGKGGIIRDIDVQDPGLARLVKQCRALPGQDLFRYRSEDGFETITSQDINAYLLRETGQHFTAKDFRTWAGSVHAVEFLRAAGMHDSQRDRNKVVIASVNFVAAKLANTPATCRKYYIHPGILDLYQSGVFFDAIQTRYRRKAWIGLEAGEIRLLRLLTYIQKVSGLA